VPQLYRIYKKIVLSPRSLRSTAPGTKTIFEVMDLSASKKSMESSQESADISTLDILFFFAGNFSLPWYAKSRPGADYYFSKLLLCYFVIADITTTGINHVKWFDERGMGKMQEWVKMQMVHNAEGDLWCEKTLIILDSKENILIMLVLCYLILEGRCVLM